MDIIKNSLPFPKKEYNKYLKIVKVKKTVDLTVFHIKQVLMLSFLDFRNGNLTTDGLADIASELFHGSFCEKDFFSVQLDNDELQSLLLELMELSYYQRRVNSSKDIDIVGGILLGLHEFYQKHKTSVPRESIK